MNINELKKLIDQQESTSLEFKSSLTQLKSAFETICAFLNTNGGSVLVGVKNSGEIIGQSISDNTQLEISNLISKIEPPVSLEIETIKTSDNKSIIRILVTPNPEDVPYVFDSKPYWRILSATKRMPQQRYQQLLTERKNNNHAWDSRAATIIKIEDLDAEEILRTLDDSINRGRTESKLATDEPNLALMRLKLLKNGMLTNAAVVLFCKDPENYFPQCLLRLARFRGTGKNHIIDSRRIYANAFVQLDEAEKFLMRNMTITSDFIPGKMARIDYPEYPLRAVREAMINAICHRDYSMPGGSISFMMYDDRLEIASYGTLPKGITLDELKQTHESFPRNEKIAHTLYKRGIIESVGTGTQEMVGECRKIGLLEPDYIERGTTFVVKFYSNPKVEKKSHLDYENLRSRQREILDVMHALGECTTTHLLESMQSPPTDRTLRTDLGKLEALGYVKRRGEGRGTLWKLA